MRKPKIVPDFIACNSIAENQTEEFLSLLSVIGQHQSNLLADESELDFYIPYLVTRKCDF